MLLLLLGLHWLLCCIGYTVRGGLWPLSLTVTSRAIRVTPLTTCRLGSVRDNLHPPWYDASRTTTPSSVRRCGWAAETFRQLLDQSAPDVVSSDVNSICNTQHDQRALGRQWQAGIRSVQASAGRFLNLTNTYAFLTNDRTDQNVWDQ